MRFLWATRGRAWGFRFLEAGGVGDPLPEYEAIFSNMESGDSAWRRTGDRVAVRFPDPVGRTDAAGRTIPHEFIVFAPDSMNINSVEDGLRILWPQVSDRYEREWDSPPSTR